MNKLYVQKKPVQQPRCLDRDWPEEGVWEVVSEGEGKGKPDSKFKTGELLLFTSSWTMVNLAQEKWYTPNSGRDTFRNVTIIRNYTVQHVTLHVDNTEAP